MAPSLKMALMDEIVSSPVDSVTTLPSSSSSSSSSSDSSSSSSDEDTLDKTTKRNIRIILEQLNDDEIEMAACTSYEYQLRRKQKREQHQEEENVVSQQQPSHIKSREDYAIEMIERYVVSKSDPIIALERLRETLIFNNEMNLNQLDEYTKQNEDELQLFFSDRKSYVQGYDIAGRSTLLFIPRLVSDHNEYKRTVLGHIWNIEKAIACSKSNDHTINVVVDFNQFYIYYHSPPYSVGKELMTILRKHYVGHVNKIFLINAPTAFTIIWNLFQSFAGTKTKEKITFVNTNDPSNDLLQYYSPLQSTLWMIPKYGCKNRQLDVKEYIHTIPFNEPFDNSTTDDNAIKK